MVLGREGGGCVVQEIAQIKWSGLYQPLLSKSVWAFLDKFLDKSLNKVGKNLTMNRMNIINDGVEYDWLNLSKESFKLKCKQLYLT